MGKREKGKNEEKCKPSENRKMYKCPPDLKSGREYSSYRVGHSTRLYSLAWQPGMPAWDAWTNVY